MQYSREFGLSAPELGWVPAPSYILRRAMLLARLSGCRPGRVLEIGCGAGALLYDLSLRGFSGLGVEPSERAFSVASDVLAGAPGVELATTLPSPSAGLFDYVLALEVLEHIEDDCGALALWRQYLKPGGQILVSVPAHEHRWGPSDVWAGHWRRYGREQIISRVVGAGFEVDRVDSIGWPLTNWIEPIRGWVHAWGASRGTRPKADPAESRKKASARSGIERRVETVIYPLYASPLGKCVFALFGALQERGSSMDRGTGHLVCARRA